MACRALHWSISIVLLLRISLSREAAAAADPPRNNVTDRLALLAIKNQITGDPHQVLASWTGDSIDFCNWRGVRCALKHQRVSALNLSSLSLAGTLSSQIANLTFLSSVDLSANRLSGQIPKEIGLLFRLRKLRLGTNLFHGEIPPSLSNCSRLSRLDVSSNRLEGDIPSDLGFLTNLQHLLLYLNNLTGGIPPSLGNLSSLVQFSVARNGLEGGIPEDLGLLKNLQVFQISQNNFSGIVPSSIYNLSYIQLFSVTSNHLHGTLPWNLGLTFPNLELFYVSRNRFTGSIPVSLSNATLLRELYFTHNSFTGGVPMDVGHRLQFLTILSVGSNQMGTGKEDDLKFVDSLTNCSYLQKFGFHENNFYGPIPDSIANLSTRLEWLAIGENQLYGSIPAGIENLVNLSSLYLNDNDLTGNVPETIGKLRNLEILGLSGNRFSGEIPDSIGSMTNLLQLWLQENNFEGRIPSSIGNCQKLLLLNASQNNLSGAIPKQVIGISSLSISLNLAHNSFTGSLPSEVGGMESLEELDVSYNRLNSEIPETLGNCRSLRFLRLQGNFFNGTIPSSLSSLNSINVLDLSHNNLTGNIPEYLGNFSFLHQLNLSFNNFDGKLPEKGVFQNLSALSILGNRNLCGGLPNLKLPECYFRAHKTRKKSFYLGILFPVILIATFLIFSPCLCAVLYGRRKTRKPTTTSAMREQYTTVSYSDLRKATNDFSESNLIGMGSYGSVYKGKLALNDTTIAVKVLNLQRKGASKSFTAECEALRNLRHRNLVKVLSSCSSIDFKGNDFKALVYEFMTNGSLDDWLHPREDHHQRSLSLNQRLNIVIDVGHALDYLHNHLSFPIVHCDLKPTNVLLDEDMTAHVGDFGLAKILFESNGIFSTSDFSSVAIKGSIGYVAPEYGMGSDVSILGDVYSYGILLLETFTGRKPTNDMFGLSLHDIAKMYFPNRVLEIIDPHLIEEGGSDDYINDNESYHAKKHQVLECIASIVRIGITCSMERPMDRMQMKDVVSEIVAIREKFS